MVLEYAKEEIRFDFNKIEIKPEFNWILDRIVDILNQYPDYFLRIGGHTDSVGDEAYNQMLSERRVKSVYTYLVDKGIPQHRMVYFGFGESRPRTTNKTPVERQLNRRVEFELFLE
jgi:outer membrane protein OmpA-like peptidoglycan-associated protein